MKSVTLKIEDRFVELAREERHLWDAKTLEEYFQAVLDRALERELRESERCKEPLFPFTVWMPVREDDDEPQFYEDEGGGVHHVDERDDDLDDGIPF